MGDRMANLDAARTRLERALERLEQALGGLADARDPGLAAEVLALRQECARLSAALEEARAEQRRLREVADRVAERLGGSIAEIDEFLES